jgi:hypothetical protein
MRRFAIFSKHPANRPVKVWANKARVKQARLRMQRRPLRKTWRIASGACERLWAGNAKICRLIHAVKVVKGPQRRLWIKQKRLCAELNGL